MVTPEIKTRVVRQSRTKRYYVCPDCGKETEVGRNEKVESSCYSCCCKANVAREREHAAVLLGAKVVSFELASDDSLSTAFWDKLGSLVVETPTGVRYSLAVGGYEEHYIDVEIAE